MAPSLGDISPESDGISSTGSMQAGTAPFLKLAAAMD
jgi:hypothetical protein